MIEVRLDDPGDTEELEVLSLMVSDGATVSEGTALMEIATDKANVEIEAPADGVVALKVAEGDIVAVDAVLATVS